MRSRKSAAASDGLKYLSQPLLASIHAECARVETQLGHVICGRYLGTRDGNPDVCWESRGHAGHHI
jgi:hypothetical protein